MAEWFNIGIIRLFCVLRVHSHSGNRMAIIMQKGEKANGKMQSNINCKPEREALVKQLPR